MDKNLYLLLQEIRKKYGMFFGCKSLRRLLDFINGYIECICDRDGVHPEYLGMDFLVYIADLYNVSENKHWSSIIISNSKSDEEAFDKFYEHMEEFLKLKGDNSYYLLPDEEISDYRKNDISRNMSKMILLEKHRQANGY
ncbi:MAG: hypothetical protein FWF08_02210 [Oscillospiraceae bacterium]|nr:hypothetical protein [Oscillospiraceae bacterium]